MIINNKLCCDFCELRIDETDINGFPVRYFNTYRHHTGERIVCCHLCLAYGHPQLNYEMSIKNEEERLRYLSTLRKNK